MQNKTCFLVELVYHAPVSLINKALVTLWIFFTVLYKNTFAGFRFSVSIYLVGRQDGNGKQFYRRGG